MSDSLEDNTDICPLASSAALGCQEQGEIRHSSSDPPGLRSLFPPSSQPKLRRNVKPGFPLKSVTSNNSQLLGFLKLKEGGCIDQGAEGDVDHEHGPRPGGDLHLAWAVAARLAQLTHTFPTHFYRQTKLFV